MNIAIIGGGAMGSAYAKCFLEKSVLRKTQLLIVELDQSKREQLSNSLGCKVAKNVGADLDHSLDKYNIIILAVKPVHAKSVLADIAPLLNKNQLVISIMAGVTVTTLVKLLGSPNIIRAMPNTPVQISQGVSCFYATSAVSKKHIAETLSLFETAGLTVQVQSEDAIDAATAISGSGPAYIFYFAEQMVTRAKELGFSETDSETLVLQTIKGAALLWQSKKVSPEQLRKEVTSKGGTTEAALSVFEEKQLGIILQQAIQKAYQKAKELTAS